MTLSAHEKIAKILRTDKHYLFAIEKRFAAITGKANVFEDIVAQNDVRMRECMLELGVSASSGAKEVYDALISKVEADDHLIYQGLGRPESSNPAHCQRIADIAREISGKPRGMFLKLDKAREFLLKEPPKKVMASLGYATVEDMVAKEEILEVYTALRFIEGSEWLNDTFFKQYDHLTPEDFEERDVVVKALPEKWGKVAADFVAKKKHNISHLKELGVVFVIPATLGISGEILRMFVLLLHYLREIPFYSKLFRDIARSELTFAANFQSLLRGDVIERHFPDSDRSLWLVVQRYLAKDDENDWRLFVPHINPEAIHWSHAIEEDLVQTGVVLNHFAEKLMFWRNLGPVGDYFKDESGVDILVSFNLVDTVMSLVKEKEMIKYLYHHQEEMWNHIFRSYFGQEQLEEYSWKYLLQGYFEV